MARSMCHCYVNHVTYQQRLIMIFIFLHLSASLREIIHILSFLIKEWETPEPNKNVKTNYYSIYSEIIIYHFAIDRMPLIN